MSKVSFRLAEGFTALRHCVGGHEISIDGNRLHTTDDPAAIAALDAHPAAERNTTAKPKAKPRKPRKPAAPAPKPPEEAVS